MSTWSIRRRGGTEERKGCVHIILHWEKGWRKGCVRIILHWEKGWGRREGKGCVHIILHWEKGWGRREGKGCVHIFSTLQSVAFL